MKKPPLFGFDSISSLHQHLIREGVTLSEQSVRNWVRGGLPTVGMLRRVAKALDLSKEELFEWVIG